MIDHAAIDEARFWASEVPAMLDAWANPGSGTDEILAILEEQLAPVLDRAGPEYHPAILDLGCGAGRLALPFAAAHPEVQVVGVDSCDEMLAEARQRRAAVPPEVAVFQAGTPSFLSCDGRRLPLIVRELAGAWCVTVAQHISASAVQGYIGEVAERLTPGGLFVLQVVAGDVGELAPYSFVHDPPVVRGWMEAAGLEPVWACAGCVFDEWYWIAAEAAQ